MYPRTTFYGFGSTTATCSPSHGRRRLPWPRPSRGSWCRSPTTLFNCEGDLSSPPSTRLQTGSFNQHGATVSRRRRWWHYVDSIYCLSPRRVHGRLVQSLTRGQKVQSRREREIKNSFLQFREKKEKPEIPFASFEREKIILKEYAQLSRGEREMYFLFSSFKKRKRK